ncbi:hypothetical protein MOQ_003604 [Trypanosoma cruzi marinkellei]|uniref:Uncharacterized protein n=1 Tax=Trypanosoma cruzi marinkellei TaxID=85056 RepID=K2MBK8_TRYCR|nr:hypothetical protein MOQ_003604 [Trypanosoma cruzi marinkellei]
MFVAGSGGTYDYTLSGASMRDGCVVVLGITTKIILVTSSETGGEVLSVNDGQIVRGVALLRSPNGALCVAAGGDGKRINVYRAEPMETFLVSQARPNNVGAGELKLLFSFGPHTKRITHVTTCDGNTILFADKFGEVFRLFLVWGLNDSLTMAQSDAAAPMFLLQHFSVMSALFLSAPICQRTPDMKETRRLFTCDKDCHVRVSCYPETFRIEQFLWTESPQSVVTSIAEVPDFSEKKRYSYFVTGSYKGKVHLWAADNALTNVSPTEPFTLFGTIFAPEQVDMNEEGAAAVVSVVYITSSSSHGESDRHAANGFLHGILIAYANAKDVVFVPLMESVDDHRLFFSLDGMTRTRLDSSPLAMVGLANNSALVLGRNGCVHVLQLVGVTGEGAPVCLVESRQVAMETAIKEIEKEHGGILFEKMDIFSQWHYDAVDPRTRKTIGTRMDSEEDEDENNDDDNKDGGEDVTRNTAVEDKLIGNKRKRMECRSDA